MNSKGRADGDIIINGSWRISGSAAGSTASSTIENDNADPSLRWTLNVSDWVIEDTRTQPALFHTSSIFFAFVNLTATSNEEAIVDFHDDINCNAGAREYTLSVLDSYFALNQGLLFSFASYVMTAGTSLTMSGCTFDANQGGVLDLKLSDSVDVVNDTLPISVSHSVFERHNSTTQPLLRFESDLGSACSSKGLGSEWPLSEQLTLENLAGGQVQRLRKKMDLIR